MEVLNQTLSDKSCLSRFFFQAEDGIRDTSVTGVQTCALPIFTPITPRPCLVFATITSTGLALAQKIEHTSGMFCTTFSRFMGYASRRMRMNTCPQEIGRASCRERV